MPRSLAPPAKLRLRAARASWLERLRRFLRGLVPRGRPLCDTCKYDYGDACTRPERPNAMRCPDYKRR